MKPLIEPQGVTAVDALIGGLGDSALSVYTVAFPAIREDFQRLEAQRFADEGPGWESLAGTTIRIKERAGHSQPDTPMVATADLLYSLAGDTEHSVYEAGPEELIMGTDLEYAQYHQDGPRQIKVFGRGSARLPQRKVVDITELDAARWAGIIQAALTRPGAAFVVTGAL